MKNDKSSKASQLLSNPEDAQRLMEESQKQFQESQTQMSELDKILAEAFRIAEQEDLKSRKEQGDESPSEGLKAKEE